MKTLVKALVCAAVIASVPSFVSAQIFGYSVTDQTQRLYEIDVTTGIAEDLGPVNTEAELEGLFSLGSSLFGYAEFDPTRADLPTQVRLLLKPQPEGD